MLWSAINDFECIGTDHIYMDMHLDVNCDGHVSFPEDRLWSSMEEMAPQCCNMLI